MAGFGGWQWPPEGRRVPGSVTVRAVMPGEALTFDRIGSEQGTDLWPSGAPFATRSLPPDRLALPRRTYRLVGDHPVIAAGGLLLESAVSAPWFGQPGGAPIYRLLDQDGTPLTVRELLAFRLLTDTTAQEIPA